MVSVFLTFSSAAFSEPTVFGLNILGTNKEQVQKLYPHNYVNEYNIYSKRMMMEIDAKQIKLEGVNYARVIFNTKDLVVGFESRILVGSSPYIGSLLRDKYKLVSQGEGMMVFSDGNTRIELNNKFSEVSASLNYYHNSYYNVMNKAIKERKEKAEGADRAML
jgi:hypothetical protein